MWNGYPVKMLCGTEVEIIDKKINITPDLQKDFTQTSNIPVKKLNDQDWEIYENILETLTLTIINLNLVKLNQIW